MEQSLEMKEIDFDVTLQTGELYSFTMRHTYFSISGIFSLLISVGCIVACMMTLGSYSTTTSLLLLFVASLFTIIQPLMLYAKCKAQIKRSENINAALHYTVSEDGICVSQEGQEVAVKWYDIRKVVYAKKGIYLYMSPVRAFIFPKGQCMERYDEMCSLIAEQMKKYKDYVPEEEEAAEEGAEGE